MQMDNLTHSLVGLFLARAGLNRLAPDATLAMVLAANLPDADIVMGLGGAPSYLEWHRGWTHSLPCSILVAAIAVLLVRAFTRKKENWLGAVLAAWVAVLSHIVLDLTNNYGVRIWAPFSRLWFHWDTTYVIDPWIWTGLLLCLVAPLLGDLILSEIGKQRRAYPGRAWAIAGLMFLLVWDGGRAILHQRAIAILDSRLYGGAAPVETAAFPTAMRPWQWDGLVETGDAAFLYSLELGDPFDPGAGKTFHRGDPGDATSILGKDRAFRALIDFSQYPLWRVTADAYNARYTLTDLRFGDPIARTFTCSARIAQDRNPADARCDFTFAANYSPEAR